MRHREIENIARYPKVVKSRAYSLLSSQDGEWPWQAKGLPLMTVHELTRVGSGAMNVIGQEMPNSIIDRTTSRNPQVRVDLTHVVSIITTNVMY
jgi:hypothetical protein